MNFLNKLFNKESTSAPAAQTARSEGENRPNSFNAEPLGAQSVVKFDENGKVLRINAPQGQWAHHQSGQHRY